MKEKYLIGFSICFMRNEDFLQEAIVIRDELKKHYTVAKLFVNDGELIKITCVFDRRKIKYYSRGDDYITCNEIKKVKKILKELGQFHMGISPVTYDRNNDEVISYSELFDGQILEIKEDYDLLFWHNCDFVS